MPPAVWIYKVVMTYVWFRAARVRAAHDISEQTHWMYLLAGASTNLGRAQTNKWKRNHNLCVVSRGARARREGEDVVHGGTRRACTTRDIYIYTYIYIFIYDAHIYIYIYI